MCQYAKTGFTLKLEGFQDTYCSIWSKLQLLFYSKLHTWVTHRKLLIQFGAEEESVSSIESTSFVKPE